MWLWRKLPRLAFTLFNAKWSAIASSSLLTEWVKGKHLDDAEKIRNTEIAEELALPPVKIHCSVLAEDAIKTAVRDVRAKQAS